LWHPLQVNFATQFPVRSARWVIGSIDALHTFPPCTCCCLGETISLAVLQAYGRTTYLATTFKSVPRGTEGAVSLEGSLAGLGAALGFAAVAVLVGQVRFGFLHRLAGENFGAMLNKALLFRPEKAGERLIYIWLITVICCPKDIKPCFWKQIGSCVNQA